MKRVKRDAAGRAKRAIQAFVAMDQRCPEDYSVKDLSRRAVKVDVDDESTVLGEGTHSRVFQGKFASQDVAVKVLKHKGEEYLNEARLLKHVQHDHVL